MAKLTYEDKKEIVRLYDEEHYGYRKIAEKYNVHKTIIEQIIRKYHLHGESSLIKNKNRKFTADIKLEVVTRALNGESKKSLGIEYMIRTSQIIFWLKKYEEFGYNGLIDKPKGRPPNMKKEKKTIDPNDKDAIIKEKDQRILELEAEVEALKKLRALVCIGTSNKQRKNNSNQ